MFSDSVSLPAASHTCPYSGREAHMAGQMWCPISTWSSMDTSPATVSSATLSWNCSHPAVRPGRKPADRLEDSAKCCSATKQVSTLSTWGCTRLTGKSVICVPLLLSLGRTRGPSCRSGGVPYAHCPAARLQAPMLGQDAQASPSHGSHGGSSPAELQEPTSSCKGEAFLFTI